MTIACYVDLPHDETAHIRGYGYKEAKSIATLPCETVRQAWIILSKMERGAEHEY